MSELASTVGFVVIVVLYASVGVLAVLGSVFVTRKLFAPRHEQVFYGLFLVAIAAFYLAFAAYFGAGSSWAMESTAVIGRREDDLPAVAGKGAALVDILIYFALAFGVYGIEELFRRAGMFPLEELANGAPTLIVSFFLIMGLIGSLQYFTQAYVLNNGTGGIDDSALKTP